MSLKQSIATKPSLLPKQCFITTPIFYANGEPHLGHAYSGIIADIFHRFSLLLGSESRLITGTDEHGQKIAQTALSRPQSTQEFVDATSKTFQALWPQLAIEPNVFIRTTAEDHQAHIQDIWTTLESQNDIYLGQYSGEYCVACEQYYPPRELVDNRLCPVHKQPVVQVEEQTNLFRLDKYRAALLEYYQKHPNVIAPQHFQNTIIEQLKSAPLADLSISRINNKWGIQVPSHHQHTVYVWIDALFSYITAIQRTGAQKADIANTQHILGKDILLFHAVYWPAFLLALNLPLPKKLIVHGWWTIDGEKISKSNPETTVNPSVFAKQLTTDGLRYALVRQKPRYRDGNVVLDEFAELINADLLNTLANLVKRNHTLIAKVFAGKITLEEVGQLDLECATFVDQLTPCLKDIVNAYQDGDLHQVTKVILALLAELNGFFHHRAPWLVRKGQPAYKSKQTCLVVTNFIRELAWLSSPIIPKLSQRIIAELGEQPCSVLRQGRLGFEGVAVKSANSHWQRVEIA